MTEDRLDKLFDLTKNQPEEISVDEIGNWVNGALAGLGFLAGLKLLLTKKLIVMGMISSVFTGVVITTTLLLTNNGAEKPLKKATLTIAQGAEPVATHIPVAGKDTIESTSAKDQEPALSGMGKIQELFPQVTPLKGGFIFPEIEQPMRSKDVADVTGEFTRIDANGFVRFKLVQGTESKISLNFSQESDPDMFEYKIEDKVLRIKGNEENKPEEIVITVKNLEKLELNGFCSAETSDKLTFRELEIELEGFSKAVILGSAEKLDVELNGESKLEYTGMVEKADLDINGMSTVLFNGNAETLELEINGNSNVVFKGDAESADIEANGSSEIDYSGNTKKFELESNGESKIQLSGVSEEADIELNGTGKMRAEGFKIQRLTIEMNGDCEGSVQVTDTLDVELSGMTNLTYSGSPQIARQEVQKFCKLKKR